MMVSVVGFSFTRVLAEKKAPVRGKVTIKNNVAIRQVEKSNINLDPKQQSVKVTFTFTTQYQPSVGSIDIDGHLIILLPEKESKTLLDGWEKNKQVPGQMMAPVLNSILDRCNVEALMLSRDMSMPSPVKLPRVEVRQPGTAEAPAKKAIKRASKATNK